jgi:phage repressor protein C with HTH and peptisase S24 domain
MEAYEIINQILNDKGLKKKDLQNKIETMIGETFPKATFYTYLDGTRTIPQNLKVPFAKALDVSITTIFHDKNTMELIREIKTSFSTNDNTISLPVFEAVAGCGAEGYLEQLQYSKHRLDIAKELFPLDINTKDLAVIRIVGDSMSPYLDENDWAIIQLRKGDIVLADSVYLIVHGQNVQIKSCQFQADGSCKLISNNSIYPPITAEAGNWDIVGKVVARLKVGSLFQLK